MTFYQNDKEYTLQFTTKNYMELRKRLGGDNLRKRLLKAATDSDYEVLAKTIGQFCGVSNLDEAYSIIDMAQEKQELFYQIIVELGENGFFEKTTTEKLKVEAQQPEIDMQAIVNRVMPEATAAMLKNHMMTGANT